MFYDVSNKCDSNTDVDSVTGITREHLNHLNLSWIFGTFNIYCTSTH